MKIFERSVWSLITAFFVILTILSFVGSAIAMNYEGQINSALKIQVFRRVDNSDDDSVFTDYYKSDYFVRDENGNVKYTVDEKTQERKPVYDDEAMRANSFDVAQRVADESTVLLWNNNDALPLDRGAKIGFFGVSSQKSRYIYTGTGSGFISYSGLDDIKSSCEANGLNVDNSLWQVYKYASSEFGYSLVGAQAAGVDDANYGEYRINEASWSDLQRFDETLSTGALENTDNYKDAAVMVISRNGGEDYDTNFVSDGDDCADGGCYLDLSAGERDVLSRLCALKSEKKIARVILLINSATPMQTMTIDDYDIDACAWVGMGGNVAAKQIANLLSGAANPSGRLVDTWVKDIDSSPVNENFGDHTFTESKGLPARHKYTHNNKYLVYQEGIYVGYKYYETRYEDYVLGVGNADGEAGVKAGAGGWSYADEMGYTFGHGLSYTTFAYSDYKVKETKDGEYEVSVTITNTGDCAGKEVFQVYIQKPYTDYDKNPDHPVEKAAVELVAFKKTDMLYPAGESGKNSQTLTLTVSEYDFKSYDAYGEGTYILEKGDYYIACGSSAHDALNNILEIKADDAQKARMDERGDASLAHKITVEENDFEKYSVSPYTGEKVENLFSNADLNLYEGTSDQKITYLSRNDWNATYPEPVSLKCVNDKMVADMQYYTGITEDPDATIPEYETVSDEYGALSLIMLKDYEYDDMELWNALMDQTSYAEQTYLITYGAHVLAGAKSVNAPGGLSQNGPSGINQPNPALGTCMIFPCQVNMAATWNAPLVEELGNAFGMEMMHVDYEGLNGPGANIHRSAYSGRNWEYFSEDGVMTGEMLSAETVGLMNRGCILYVKHMLLNDEERNRYGTTVWANEQSIREIYAKAFEKACAVTHLNGIMSSFNRIGCTWAGRHKGLLTDLLRGEWGFEGAVQSDAAVGQHMGVANSQSTNAAIFAEALIAGQDFWLMGGSTDWMDGYKDNPTVARALREAARRMLFTQLHSHAMNGMTADTQIIRITPWWQSALLALRITSLLLTIGCATMAALSFVFASKKFKEWKATAKERAAEKERVRLSAFAGVSGGAVGGAGGGYAEPTRGDAVAEEPAGAAGWFKRHKKVVLAVGAAVIAIVVAISVIVPIAASGGGGASDPGHTGPINPGVEEVTCEHKCPVCGGCLDAESTNEACVVKCGENLAESYTFEAENTRVKTTSGTLGAVSTFTDREDTSTGELVSGRGNFSSNTGASLTFEIAAPEDTTVTLLARVSRGTGGITRFTDTAFPVVTSADGNVQLLDRATTVPKATSSSWFDFIEVNLGCVELSQGVNTIKFAPVGTAYNFDYIAMLSDVALEWSDGTEADIVGAPRHGIQVSFGGVQTNSEGTLIATATAGTDLTKTVSVTVNGKDAEFEIVKSAEKEYGVTIDVSAFALDDGEICTVKFIGENGATIGRGMLEYKKHLENINTEPKDESGWNVFELTAYDAPLSQTLSAGVEILGNVTPATARKNDRNYYPLGNLDQNVGNGATFYVYSDKEAEAALYGEFGNLDEANANKLCDWADLTINGEQYTSDADMPFGERYLPSNVYTRLGYIRLKQGLNAITFTVNNAQGLTGHNIYGIKLAADGADMSVGSASETDDSEWKSYVFNSCAAPKSEELAEGVSISSGLKIVTDEKRENNAGYKPIGNLDESEGASVTFNVVSDKAVDKAGLYMELGRLTTENTFDDCFDLTVNGSDVNSSAEMPVGENYTPSNTYTKIAFVSLKEGVNVLKFTVNSSAKFNVRNLYGIKLTAENATLTAGSSTDIFDDSEWTKYEFRALSAPESQEYSDGVTTADGTAALNVATGRPNGDKYYPIGGLNTNLGASVTFEIYSTEETDGAGLYIELSRRATSVTFDSFLKFEVNGVDMTYLASGVTMPVCEKGQDFSPSDEYTFLGFVPLKQGRNEIKFTVISGNTNYGNNIYGLQMSASETTLSLGGGE